MATTEKTTEKKADKRTRNWVFILYPESAPTNWKELLKEEMISFAVSPLHDLDISDENTGVLKKAHYHIMLCFDSMKAFSQVEAITKKLNCPIPQPVNSYKGTIRYMVHKDDANKHQYNINDIYVYGDIDIVTPFQTATSRYDAIKEMLNYVKENNITEFQDLMDYAMVEQEEWFRYLCDNSAYIVQEYIKSARHRVIK